MTQSGVTGQTLQDGLGTSTSAGLLVETGRP